MSSQSNKLWVYSIIILFLKKLFKKIKIEKYFIFIITHNYNRKSYNNYTNLPLFVNILTSPFINILYYS